MKRIKCHWIAYCFNENERQWNQGVKKVLTYKTTLGNLTIANLGGYSYFLPNWRKYFLRLQIANVMIFYFPMFSNICQMQRFIKQLTHMIESTLTITNIHLVSAKAYRLYKSTNIETTFPPWWAIYNITLIYYTHRIIITILSTSLLTTAWHVLGLWMEEAASRYGG
jgi:hypothetical protein